jgi:hypothetical protein
VAGGLQDLVRAINHGLSGQTAYAIYQQLMAAQGGGGGGLQGATVVPGQQPPIPTADIDKLLAGWRREHPAGSSGAGATYFTQSIARELRANGAPESYILKVKAYIDQAWLKAGGAPRQTPIIQGPRI